MTVRLQPNLYHEEMIRAWGATPVAVELKTGIEMISTGQVDAQENPLANTVAYGVDAVHHHVTMSGHLYGARGLFANRAALKHFRPTSAMSWRMRPPTRWHSSVALLLKTRSELRTRLEAAGLEFVDLTVDERNAFREASRPAIDLARRNLGEDLFDLAASS